MGDPPRARR